MAIAAMARNLRSSSPSSHLPLTHLLSRHLSTSPPVAGIVRRSPPALSSQWPTALRLGGVRGMSWRPRGDSYSPMLSGGGGGGGGDRAPTETFKRPARDSSFRSMNFVQGVLDEDKQYSRRKKSDFVHILMKRKKTFVTVTDSMGNRKTGATAGSLEEKGRSRKSRYAAEATAEQVGRSARKMALKSVVVKVKGFIFFRRKKKVIFSWNEGFRGERVRGQTPITYIQDVTQLPHNGCRLPKKRRV